jgi:hypothetical protein
VCYNERKDRKGMNKMAKKKESTPGENLAKQIIEQYHPKSVADMQDALPYLSLNKIRLFIASSSLTA